jgi:hypothetical protein
VEENSRERRQKFSSKSMPTKNFHVRSPTYPKLDAMVSQLKLMLTIERNMRGLRDSLTVHFFKKKLKDNTV